MLTIEPPPRSIERRARGLHPEEDTDLVHVVDLAVVVERRLHHGEDAEDACVVHEDVELTEPFDGLGDDRGPLSLVGDVVMAIRGSVGGQLARERVALVVEHVADHHLRALGCEEACLARPLPSCAAADECHLAVEPSHGGGVYQGWRRKREAACHHGTLCRTRLPRRLAGSSAYMRRASTSLT